MERKKTDIGTKIQTIIRRENEDSDPQLKAVKVQLDTAAQAYKVFAGLFDQFSTDEESLAFLNKVQSYMDESGDWLYQRVMENECLSNFDFYYTKYSSASSSTSAELNNRDNTKFHNVHGMLFNFTYDGYGTDLSIYATWPEWSDALRIVTDQMQGIGSPDTEIAANEATYIQAAAEVFKDPQLISRLLASIAFTAVVYEDSVEAIKNFDVNAFMQYLDNGINALSATTTP